MNYRHVYMLIIEHAKSEEKLGIRAKGNGNYYERHHILPRSLFPLWENRKSNIVLLTAREHFFCHQLLTKVYPCYQMFKALSIFCKFKQQDRSLSSKEYQICREAANKANLLWWNLDENKEKFRKKCVGRKLSESTKNKISETKRKNYHKKFWWTNEIVETYSETCPNGFHKGRKKFTNETIENIRKGAIGNKSTSGMKHWTNGVSNTTCFECPGEGWWQGVTRHISSESKEKISKHNREKNLGRRWWTNGKILKFCIEKPGDDFILGRVLI